MMTIQRKFAWKPDVPDPRDHYFALPSIVPEFADHVDPIGFEWTIEDQGSIGSCVGCSSTSGLELATRSTAHYSKLMAYYCAREIEGTVAQDDGCMIRDVIKAFIARGVCDEKFWPYDVTKYATMPPPEAYQDAMNLIGKIAAYQRVMDLNGLKVALSNGLPVIFGFVVPAYFMDYKDGVVQTPKMWDRILGGHAVLAVGYDDRKGDSYVWVRNSWGASWGIAGHFRMDQRYFTDRRRLVDDLWLIRPRT